MLLELAQWLAKDLRVFNVFSYITLRAVLACLTALAVSLILGPYMIRKITAYKIGQAVREDAHHGRRADPGVDLRHRAALGRPVQPAAVGGTAGHPRLRHHRLGGRLP